MEMQDFGVKAVAVGMRVAMALKMFEGVTEGADGSEGDRSQRTVLFSLVAARIKERVKRLRRRRRSSFERSGRDGIVPLRNKDAESVVRTDSNIDGTRDVIFDNLKTFTRTEAGLKIVRSGKITI